MNFFRLVHCVCLLACVIAKTLCKITHFIVCWHFITCLSIAIRAHNKCYDRFDKSFFFLQFVRTDMNNVLKTLQKCLVELYKEFVSVNTSCSILQINRHTNLNLKKLHTMIYFHNQKMILSSCHHLPFIFSSLK